MRFGGFAKFLSKPEISDFASVSLLLGHLFEQNILALKISMNNIFLMNGLQPLKNLHKYFDSLIVFEYLVGHAILIGVQVAILAILHDQEDGLCL